MPAINSSCKKVTTAESGKIDTLTSSTIIYTDVNPDSAISGNSAYNLDLNNDGIYDFTIKTVFGIVSVVPMWNQQHKCFKCYYRKWK